MKHRLPESLANLPRWLVTEPCGDGDTVMSRPYSPVTLSPLRHNHPGDYSNLAYAVESWASHSHWFDGIAFRMGTPWLVVIIQHAVTPAGHVTKAARDVAKQLGGCWEFARNDEDVQAILWSSQAVTYQVGLFAGHAVHVCGNGICPVTLRPVPGCGGDPLATNQEALRLVLAEIALTPAMGFMATPAGTNSAHHNRQRGGTGEQLDLFQK